MADLLESTPLHRVASGTAVTPYPEGGWQWTAMARESMLQSGFEFHKCLVHATYFPSLAVTVQSLISPNACLCLGI